jgi:hypothetical protein
MYLMMLEKLMKFPGSLSLMEAAIFVEYKYQSLFMPIEIEI